MDELWRSNDVAELVVGPDYRGIQVTTATGIKGVYWSVGAGLTLPITGTVVNALGIELNVRKVPVVSSGSALVLDTLPFEVVYLHLTN